MAAMALTTHFIGVHTVLGAFVAGVLIGESPILTKHIDEQLRGLIMAFFMPVFFGMAGLSTDLTILKDPLLLAMALGLIAIASVGKFVGAFIGGEIGGLNRREALALACGMNARGSTEVIVATIGLSMGALTQNLFTMIVAMAVTTTMAMPPMLRWGLSRVPMTREEKERLEREEIEAKGFVPNLERILLAVDDSPNGHFASRLAGLLAGPRGIPITALPLPASGRHSSPSSTKTDEDDDKAASKKVKENVKAAADEGQATQPQEDKPDPVDVLVRSVEGAAGQAVATEAERGYDLLFIGLGQTQAKNGVLDHGSSLIARAFDGPLALVAGQGRHLENAGQSTFRILVPVNGTEPSRRAAEVAVELARAVRAPITALYVSNARPEARTRGRTRVRSHEQAILKDIVRLADQYDLDIRTAVRAGVAPDEAILAEVKHSKSDLIVMGAHRRPGDKLFFGDTAMTVLEKRPVSILLLST
jgi:nucleotide-binding universal stress UspA family protein